MGYRKGLLLFAIVIAILNGGDGCQMDGVANWLLTMSEEIYDTHRGVFFNRSTTNIEAIVSTNSGEGVNAGLYLSVSMDGSYFIVSTNDAYALYEENETSESMSFTVNFRCTGGSANSLVFDIQIRDTNNNPPTFRPSDEYEFTITPPLPPGFQITGCLDDNIIVRDIDLTTERIDFEIEENPYFEIAYDGRSSTDPKEFVAVLRTKDLIRTLPDVLELTISATDVDRTGDPPITTTGRIRVQANDDFQFPEEPVFSQPFYRATYSNDQLTMQELISLQQGFHQEVAFSLDGEYLEYFGLESNGNQLSIIVTSPLPGDILRTGQIILVVKAEREHTSGATTTVIVQLPEVLGLEFAQLQYDGVIVDNELQPLQLTLTQGYEDGVTVALVNEHASFFAINVEGNVITLTMMPLDAHIIDENNFVTLQVVASNEYSSTTAVVTLDIVKDDNTTPVFEKAIYTGEYDPNTGLTLEQITLVQGYDETVSFSLQGDHVDYFEMVFDGPNVVVTSLYIPSEIWVTRQLYLTLEATKPRSVAAVAAILITMPSERTLAFEAPTYSGTLQDSNLTLSPIVLSVGYSGDVIFALNGEYAPYFTLSNVQNQASINLSASLPESVILENNFLTLTLSATGLHAVPTFTTVLLEIIKQDVTTPVFTENIYRAIYSGDNAIEFGNISLAQGYDDTVTFRLEGDHAQYFEISNVENNLSILLASYIPAEVIFQEKLLLFNILADKPLTVSANAAVSITFPQEMTDATIMRFSQNTYTGSLKDNELSLESIVLENGYASGTEFTLSGEFASYFTLNSTENVITILLTSTPGTEILDNNFILLEVEANRERAVSVSTSVIIEVVKEEIVSPLFGEAYYRGVYAEAELHFEEVISLSQGYDETVSFQLEGENAVWFSIMQSGNSIILTLNNTNIIPDNVIQNNNQLLFTIVAYKPDTINGRAAISIDLFKEVPEPVIMGFTQTSYVGSIDNGELFAPTITLVGDREPIQLNLTGEYAPYFEVSQSANNVQIRLVNGLPTEVIDQLAFIILDIEASYPEAISGYTTIVFEILKQPQIVTPVFEQAYYAGEFSEQGLHFEQSIRLIQGFDETVLFTLAGDDAQWFELVYIDESNLSLVVNDTGLGQITDRSHLVFSILANKPESVAGRAAIIVNLSDFHTVRPLRFSQNFYLGSIESGNINIDSINLEEGYSPDMNVTFTGDYADYFQITNAEGLFTLQLLSELPANVIDTNNVLVFTLEVQIEDIRAHATVILEVIKMEVAQLMFEEAYYVGSYSLISGFTFDPQITLIEGYDDTVSFSLVGDHSQWFGIVENQNTVSLTQVNPIPVEIVSNNQQLVFIIEAENSGNITARSTIIVSIIDDISILGFESNVYLGDIQNNVATIETVVLSEGYSENVVFTLLGDLANYFTLTSEEASVTISLQSAIPGELIPSTGIILVELQASAPDSISAYATLIFGVVQESVEYLSFSEAYYTGHYTESDGLVFEDTITLIEGYDENVRFLLEGESSQYFEAVIAENSVTLRVLSPIPPEVVINDGLLIITIHADKPAARNATATIVISFINENIEGSVLEFDRIIYLGSIENNTANLDPITLSEGYSQDVSFALFGELSGYFNLTSVGAIVTINLQTSIPEELIPDNRIIVVELQATAPQTMPALTAIVFEVILEETRVTEHLIFSETYYTGHYTDAEGLTFEDTISITEGFDENVQFELEGDSSQYFEAVVTENSVTLRVISPLPPAVLMNNQQLIFIIRANKEGAITARAAIIIALVDEFSGETVLGFERISYLGSIVNNTANIDPITLIEGYSQNVSFTLHGDLSSYFGLTSEQAIVTITLEAEIPEQLLPNNGIVILELQASAPQTMSAFAVVVFEVEQESITPNVNQLVFSETYYTGHYTDVEGLTFENVLSLIEGYDENVQFSLEGDSSQYFEIVVIENSVTLNMISPIPPAVVTNNQQLIFIIRANKEGAATARATIVISLLDEFTAEAVLGFDRITYLGVIENGTASLDWITLSEGYTQNVSFTLHGDLASYFALTSVEATVTVSLSNLIPELLIPENGIIILELQASAPQTMSAYASIVFGVMREDSILDIEQLVFSQTYYTGRYTEIEGLVFDVSITLTEGYDENVQFSLEGDSSQYFDAVISDNSVTLRVVTAIPPGIVMNNQQLIFTIRADKPEVRSARATIVISLPDEFTEDNILSFERMTYIGSIDNNTIILEPIILVEGYTQNVSFALLGDLASYFAISNNEGTVTITLQNSIPEQVVPDNGIIILVLQASAPETISSHAAIVFELIRDITPSIEHLVFSDTYYTGHYTEIDGLVFEENISLSEGYDESVQFSLEGDSSQYFEAVVSGNSVTLIVVTPLPPAVVMNNQQLIFVIRAEKEPAITARATIVITLTDEYEDGLELLGFDRITYQGRIENETIYMDPIILTEGYTQEVSFTLHGDLASYFILSSEGSTVSITLLNPIPEQSLPNSGIIVLELQASSPQAISAHAAIVIEVLREHSTPDVELLVFSDTYYTGVYTEIEGLMFEDNITLTEGYDETVQFVLEGDNSQYFEAVVSENSVTLRVITPIPPAVVMNNQQLIFLIRAEKIGAITARATIIIKLTAGFEDGSELLGFDRITYQGTIENGTIHLDPIILTEGYTQDVSFTLHGDLASYFILSSEGSTVSITLLNPIPEQSLPNSGIIVLELQASAPQAISAHAAIVIEVLREDSTPDVELLVFSGTYYTGVYTEVEGLIFQDNITLTEGYDETVQFVLEGDDSQYFEAVVSENSVTLRIFTPIPPAVVMNNQKLIFVIRAERADAVNARATIVIALTDELTEGLILGFDRILYQGTIENNTINLNPITLSEGYTQDVSFTLHGDLASYYTLTVEAATITINLLNVIPDQLLPSNNMILLQLQASAPQTMSAYAAILIEVIQENVTPNRVQLQFSETYYVGHYTEVEGLIINDTITLVEGYDDSVLFALEGESAQYFETVVSGNTVILVIVVPIPPAVVINNNHLIFTIRADSLDGSTARATIVISLRDEYLNTGVLGFNQISYIGSIENDMINVESIILSEGYSEEVTFALHGAFANYFTVTSEGSTVTISLLSAIPEQIILDNQIIVLELQALAPETVSAYATIIFTIIPENIEEIIFTAPYFIGYYTIEGNLIFEGTITLSQGYDENVQFSLEGEQSQWFQLVASGNSVSIILNGVIPQEVLDSHRKLVFVIVAEKPGTNAARSTIIISLDTDEEANDSEARFEKILFEGLVQGGMVRHETIALAGFNGTNIQITGEYAELFVASTSNGFVIVEGLGSMILPNDVTFIALELHADSASAVLLLNVIPSDNPVLPSVTFSSSSYILRVDVSQTGLVGRVHATADNGEAIIYSLNIDNAHLLQRLSINDEGELQLSAPANSGVYVFNVLATTVFTQTTGSATVHLTVEAITSCGEDDFVLPPLIILDRDEESAYQNLVILNGTIHEGCTYRLSNRWPLEQSWLYVDENGLHTTAIDREHESIAFMALSQVQVELTLECDSDNTVRRKRSVNTETRLDHLGPYDYGDNKWILTDSILYNPRRSLVNLIVNDINDNAPIFVGKEVEPIVVGYPVADLDERILPRALTKVEATDADVGENAALVYWSMEDILAVSPYSGFVHIRDNAQLENNTILTIYATDRHGQGLNGSLDLLVKLIDTSHIAVVTVRDAFLDDEDAILDSLSAAVGYEVKTLRSTIISDVSEAGESRRKREAVLSSGASLQLYVYGLIDQEPVAVEQLTENINTGVIGTVVIASSVSLGDHLESLEICPLPGRDTALLAATITLSVLLFILIVVTAVWFYLTWRKKLKYQEFSDENSLASRNESLAPATKPESMPKPRMNIEDLIRSERRLQNMLDTPIENVTIEPTTSPKPESKVNIPDAPIVIQSIDKLKDVDDSEDEDEYGERAKSKRKSVVTFNENVEKIIHVEDPPEETEYEVYKL